MNKRSGIYEILNTVNGKRYIGSAMKIGRRWNTHKSQLARGVHHSRVLQRAWDKYGEAAFRFNLLLLCSPANLEFYEQRFLNVYKPAYNIAVDTAAPMLGRKHSPDAIKKIGDASRARGVPPACREASRLAHIGKPPGPISDAGRAKISATHLGKKRAPFTDQHRQKLSEANIGKVLPTKTREKISKALKGRPLSTACRVAGRKARTGKPLSLETRAKISATITARWARLRAENPGATAWI